MKIIIWVMVLLVSVKALAQTITFEGGGQNTNLGQGLSDNAKAFNTLYKSERLGIKYYKKAQYKKAYKKLLPAAEAGLKSAQYLIGFLYIKGQHVPQSIKQGMAWWGVANELDVDQWKKAYNTIYEKLNDAQKKTIDDEVNLYITRYGMVTQRIKCTSEIKVGSRKPQVQCRKS